jgi:hypothetical protein
LAYLYDRERQSNHQQNHTHYQKQQLLVVLGMAVHLDLVELLIWRTRIYN